MKKINLLLILCVFLFTQCSQKTEKDYKNLKLSTYNDTLNYIFGTFIGKSIGNERGEQILKESLVPEVLIKGIYDAYNKGELFSEDSIRQFMKAHSQKVQQRISEKQQKESTKNIDLGNKFLEENASKDGVITTESGLQYQILSKGDGTTPKVDAKVKVHYHGTLVDGTVFDSSVDRGEPVTFALNQVIPGWTEGLQLMSKGSKFKFFIPSPLGYKNQAVGKIPAGSTLIFEVELIEIL